MKICMNEDNIFINTFVHIHIYIRTYVVNLLNNLQTACSVAFLAFHRQNGTFLKMDDPFKIPLGHDTFVLFLDERHAEKQNIAFMYEYK